MAGEGVDEGEAEVHDVVGVGLGPFNLGLAALLDPVDEIDALFLEARTEAEFAWHPGLLLHGASLQVPFLADLVTLADPTSRWSFLRYLHERDRLYRFYFFERFHVPRREYDAYCRWVATALPSCQFDSRVEAVRPLGHPAGAAGPNGTGTYPTWTHASAATESGARWEIHSIESGRRRRRLARHVVLGIGGRPVVPDCARTALGSTVLHSADYLPRRGALLALDSLTVVGSGQSAGEIVLDQLENGRPGRRLDWFTRSDGFLPMEYSKLGLEHFTPEYTAYFHALAPERRDRLRTGQDLLYKGLSAETSARIYDLLYERTVDGARQDLRYVAGVALRSIDPLREPRTAGRDDGARWRLTLHHGQQDVSATHDTDGVVLATGYEPHALPVRGADGSDPIARDDQGRPMVDLDYRVRLRGRARSSLFVQNGELHTHGVGAPDLGLGAYRSAVIVNAIAGREVYRVPLRTVFQTFGLG